MSYLAAFGRSEACVVVGRVLPRATLLGTAVRQAVV